jgi:outer membrane protein assembly factor BamD
VLAKSWARSPILLAVVACAVGLSACSHLGLGAKKKADTTAYEERPVDQLYAAGAQRLDDHRWGDSINYFKEVERQHPYSEWSRRAIMMQAFAHYEANQYDDAITDADRFIQLYPGHPTTAYAYYLKAECYFEQILDIGRDQAATEEALAAMREVARRYPKSEYAADARLKIDMVNDQLAGREMTIGRWYLREGNTLAAIGRFKTVVDKYQTTSQTPEALYRLVEAYLTLGIIDEANRNAAVLGYNYPGDAWYADAYRLMTEKGLHPTVVPTSKGHGLLHTISHPFGLGEAHATTPAPPPEVDTPAVLNPEGSTSSPTTDSSGTTPPPAKKKGGWFSWLPHI